MVQGTSFSTLSDNLVTARLGMDERQETGPDAVGLNDLDYCGYRRGKWWLFARH